MNEEWEDIEINLTPLIDVVFVILIMFIVVAPLLEKEEVSLAPAPTLTKQEAQAIEQQSPVVIHVYADQSIQLNHHPVSLEQLKQALLVSHAAHPNVHPQLFQDEKASFGIYQKVKNAVAEAGFETLDVLLQP